jgi:hypothetical protein
MREDFFDIFEMHEDEKSWNEEINKTLVSHQIKRHDIINIVINIIIASLCIFIFDLPLWVLPIAFIACDILLLPLNIVLFKIIPERRKRINNVNYYIRRNKKLVKLIKKYTEKLNSLSYHDNYRSILNNDIRTMENELLENEKRITELQNQKTTVTSVYEKIAKSNKEKIMETVYLISSFKITVSMKEAGINLSNIVDKSKKIIKIIDEKPEMVDATITTFNLYGSELLNILQSVKTMDKEEQVNYFDKIKELIYEYELHLDRLEERIKKNDFIKTNVDINVLLNEITKDKKGEDNV